MSARAKRWVLLAGASALLVALGCVAAYHVIRPAPPPAPMVDVQIVATNAGLDIAEVGEQLCAPSEQALARIFRLATWSELRTARCITHARVEEQEWNAKIADLTQQLPSNDDGDSPPTIQALPSHVTNWVTASGDSVFEATSALQYILAPRLASASGIVSVEICGAEEVIDVALDQSSLFAHDITAAEVVRVLEAAMNVPGGYIESGNEQTIRTTMRDRSIEELMETHLNAAIRLGDVSEVTVRSRALDCTAMSDTQPLALAVVAVRPSESASLARTIDELAATSMPPAVRIHTVADPPVFHLRTLSAEYDTSNLSHELAEETGSPVLIRDNGDGHLELVLGRPSNESDDIAELLARPGIVIEAWPVSIGRIWISGETYEQLERAAATMDSELREIDADVTRIGPGSAPTLEMQLDDARLQRFGIPREEVEFLMTLTGAGRHVARGEHDIFVRIADVEGPSGPSALLVHSRADRLVPLAEIVDLTQRYEPTVLHRRNGSPAIPYIVARVSSMADLINTLNRLHLPPGIVTETESLLPPVHASTDAPAAGR